MAVLVIVVGLTLLVGAYVVVDLLHAAERQAVCMRQHEKRLQVQREQFLAERRLQYLTRQALQQMLDEGRR